MADPNTRIPIEHHPTIHRIEPSSDELPRPLTLLELIDAVSEVTNDEKEVIATVQWMLRSGRIRLVGTFRDTPIQELAG